MLLNRRVLLFPSEIAQDTIQTGVRKSDLKLYKLIPLGILAGIFTSIGAITSTTLKATYPADQSHISGLLGATIFTIGIVLVVIAGGELFNGNILMFLARLDRKITTRSMLKNWFLVYLLNFFGTLTVVFITYQSGMMTEAVSKVFEATALAKSSYSFLVAIFRGIGCNILVCLSVWICTSAKDTTGKIVASSFPVITFIFLGFEHVIANMFFFSAALVSGTKLALSTILFNNIIPVTIGNLIGGILVAILYYFSYVYVRE